MSTVAKEPPLSVLLEAVEKAALRVQVATEAERETSRAETYARNELSDAKSKLATARSVLVSALDKVVGK